MCLVLHRILSVVVALIALLVVIISPIVIGSYADVRNWNSELDGQLRWCHDDAKMADHAGNLGLASGCVSFVVGLVLIPFILITFVGTFLKSCRPNFVTSFVLPLPVFLLSLVLFSLYAATVATSSRQFEERKDWTRPADWPDSETRCNDIPPKWNNALAWAVIQAALTGLILLYSLLWLAFGLCETKEESAKQTIARLRNAGVILHRVLAVVVALIALLVVIISPIVIGSYADVRNWNSELDGQLRWCHDDAKMADHVGNLGIGAGSVSFILALVLIPIILVTVLGAFISCCRPNLVTSFLLPLPVFLITLIIFGLYASLVAVTSRQFEEKKDWTRPADWPDAETRCNDIPPKWDNALAWAVIEAALSGLILIYSVLWLFFGVCAKRSDDEDAGIPMEKLPKVKKPKDESSDSSDSDESDDELKELAEDLKSTLRTEFDETDSADNAELQNIEKAFKKNRVYKRKRFLKQQEADLKKMGFSDGTVARLLALIAAEKAKDKERKRRRDRGYLMIDLDDTLKATFNEEDPKERKELEEVRTEFRRLKITDLDFFVNMTDKEFKQLELPLPVKNKLRKKIQELKEAEDV